eukprot:6577735-Prymnesium_polylepis.1
MHLGNVHRWRAVGKRHEMRLCSHGEAETHAQSPDEPNLTRHRGAIKVDWGIERILAIAERNPDRHPDRA